MRTLSQGQCSQSLEMAISEAWPRVPHTAEHCLFLSSREKLNSFYLLQCLTVFWLTYAYKGPDPVEKMDLEEILETSLLEAKLQQHWGHLRTAVSREAAACASGQSLVLENGSSCI